MAAQQELVNAGTSPRKMVEATTAVMTGPNTRAWIRMKMSVMLQEAGVDDWVGGRVGDGRVQQVGC